MNKSKKAVKPSPELMKALEILLKPSSTPAVKPKAKQISLTFNMSELVAVRHAIKKYIEEYSTDEEDDTEIYLLQRRFVQAISKLEGRSE